MTQSVLVEPAYFTHPDYHATFGPEVGELAALANFPPDPEQQLVLAPMFGVDRYGKSAAFEVAVIGARQNIKTGLCKIAALGKTVVMERPLFVWSAHEFRTAQESFRDLTVLIESCPDLDQLVRRIYRGNGDESIEWMGGQRIIFKARTKSGGKGLTGDDVALDEGFALAPEHMGALLPTLSARPDPQVFYGSSAGYAESEVLRGVRDRGRAGSSRRLVYAEWCAPRVPCLVENCDHHVSAVGCVLDDENMWQLANPQMGRRITVEYLRAERQAMPPAEFARERLGWWDEPDALTCVIAESAWRACHNSDSSIPGAPSFAVDISPDRAWAAIAAAGTAGDAMHVEITSRLGVIDHRPGTEWLLPRIEELKAAFPTMSIALGSSSGAESLRNSLEALGIPVDLITAHEVQAACGLFFDHVLTRKLAHLGQEPLDAAVASAKKRVEDGENAWVWGRKRSAGDITPLYAATLALYAAVEALNMSRHPAMNVW